MTTARGPARTRCRPRRRALARDCLTARSARTGRRSVTRPPAGSAGMPQRCAPLARPASASPAGAPPTWRGQTRSARLPAALPWLARPRCARCGLPAPCGPRCPARGAGVLGRVGAGRLRGRGAGAGQRAEVARRARPGAADGRADRRHGAAGAAQRRDARRLVPVPADRCAAAAAASTMPRGWPPRSRRAGRCRSRRARPARGRRRAPGRPLRAPRLAPAVAVVLRTGGRGPPAAVRRDPRRRRPHDRGDPRRVCPALRAAGAADVRAVTYARALRD